MTKDEKEIDSTLLNEDKTEDKVPDKDPVSKSEDKPEDKKEVEKPSDATPPEKKEEPVTDPAASTDDDKIALPDGTKVTYSELLSGYMKDADYRRKTAELARVREVMPETQTKEEKDEFLSKYDSKQIDEFKMLAKKLGFLTREEVQEIESVKTKDSIVNTFLASHPEYSDASDVRAKALAEELALYNLNNLTHLSKVLEKAHAAVKDKFTSSNDKAKALAQREKVKAATVGSMAGGAPAQANAAKEPEYTDRQIEIMKKMGVWSE